MKLLPFRPPSRSNRRSQEALTPEENEALRRKRWTIAILSVGFAAAIVIYFTAAAPDENPLGDPMQTKQYVHDLEVYGGKANVLAAQFREWFVGLWEGKNLAYTVAFSTVVLVWIYRAFTRLPLPADDETESLDASGDSGPHRPVRVPRAGEDEKPTS